MSPGDRCSSPVSHMETKSNSRVPAMKPLERGFRPLMISMGFGGEGSRVWSKRSASHPYRSADSWRPPQAAGGWLSAGDPLRVTGEERGGSAEATGRWLISTAGSGLCGSCMSIAEEQDISGSRVSQICSLLGISE